MASSINASTAGAGGVITTADNSGVLNLQSGGTTIATINSSGFSTPTGSTISVANTFGYKNRIINGNMAIDQRNAGASVTPTTNTYTLDRFFAYIAQSSKFSVQQNAGSVTPPAGFTNYLGATSLSAYTVGTSETFSISQKIEGFNTADLGFGTANAKTITLSFWVRSSLTGIFGGSLNNSAIDRSYPFSYTISSANTWEQKSITVAGDTSGTWIGATNGIGIYVSFSLGTGATVSTTANAWAAGTYWAPTGATSVVGTNGATFYITGIQFEVGSQATSFDFRDYGRELALCQRYYELKDWQQNTYRIATVYANGATPAGYQEFVVTKRTAPSISWSSNGTGRWIPAGGTVGTSQTATAATISIYGAGFTLSGPQIANTGWVDTFGNMQISSEL